MGKEKKEVQTQQVQTQQTQATQSPEEKRLNEIRLGQVEEFDPLQRALNQAFGGLALSLGQGGDLPGFLSGLPGGISPQAIGTQAAELASKNLAGFNQLGIADSGVAFRETAKDIGQNLLFPAEQFNIGNLLNLLNLGLSGSTGLQQQSIQAGSSLGQSLAGLRSVSQVGTGSKNQTFTGPNPFLNSFQKGLGGGLGATFGSPNFIPGFGG